MNKKNTHINEKAIQRLIRLMKLSKKQFSIILAYCNYPNQRGSIISRIKQQSKLKIHEIHYSENEQSLFKMIKKSISNQTPDTAMVIGLETVSNIDDFFLSANQIREEFRKHFSFPLIFWVTETVLNRFARIAPDFKSWATSPILFENSHEKLIAVVQQKVDQWLNEILSTEIELIDVNGISAFVKGIDADISRHNNTLPNLQLSGLFFLKGLEAYLHKNFEDAIAFYYKALDLLINSFDQTLKSFIYNCLGRCYEKNNDLDQAKKYFQNCIKACKDNPQLTKKFIRDLCRILRQKEEWDELSKATKVSPLETKDYQTLLVAHERKVHERKVPAETIIQQIIEQTTDILDSNNDKSNLDLSDPGLYIDLMENLKNLYYEQTNYEAAFETKQNKLSLEQQFGFRAFIGAGRLRPLRKKDRETKIMANEIQFSGRLLDVNKLIEKLQHSDCKLIVLHGQSGVGKSSLLEAGLKPELEETDIDGLEVKPFLIHKYDEWVRDLHKNICETQKKSYSPDDTLTNEIVNNFQNNKNKHITVLIFDQFEEFFFVNPDQKKRKKFYDFLFDSLSSTSVKVILSLREDYIHHLLECDSLTNEDMKCNDILKKKNRYPLGNFKTKDAADIIRNLTQRSHSQIDDQLIDKIVEDLSSETGEVRPVELQLVGVQLQTENIKTLGDYKPCNELIFSYIYEIIHDCGIENKSIAEEIIYELTGENNIRPLKTFSDFNTMLKESDIQYSVEQLKLVLNILVGSGLVLLMKEKPVDQYQLVHDYLVEFIRKRINPRDDTSLRIDSIETKTKNFYQKFLSYSADKNPENPFLKEMFKIGEKIKKLDRKSLQKSTFSPLIHHAYLHKMLSSLPSVYALKMLDYRRVYEGNRIKKRKKHPEYALTINFTNDGEIIAFGCSDDTIKLWNVSYESEILSVNYSQIVSSVEISPDNKILALGLSDNTVKLWNVSNRNEVNTLKGHSDSVLCVNFSPDSKILASGSSDKTIKLWSVSDGYEKMTLKGHSESVLSLDFDPECKFLASGSSDNTIKLWSLLDGNELMTFNKHSNSVLSVTFSPDGKIIASGSSDNTVTVILWKNNEVITLKGHSNSVLCVNFSPDGKILASGSSDNSIKLWNVNNGNEIKTFKGHSTPVLSVKFSPDASILASGSSDNIIRTWIISNYENYKVKGHCKAVFCVKFSPNSNILASGSYGETIRLWNVLDCYEIRKLKGHFHSVLSLNFSPNGKLLASGSSDKSIILWNIYNGNKLRILKGHSDHVTSIHFSPDGETLVSGSSDKSIKFWNVSTGDEIFTIEKTSDSIHSVSFSQDGKTLASGSNDGTIQLWNVSNKKEIKTLKGHSEQILSVKISPNNQILASGSADKSIKLWNTYDGSEIGTLKGHSHRVHSVDFSPDSKILASGSQDKSIKLWNVSDGNEIMALKGHSKDVRSINFSSDGKFLASGSFDHSIILWNFDIENLLKKGYSSINSYLTK